MTHDASSVLWTPLSGPQTQALESRADILFYGGAAGGGKTDLIIGAATLRHRRSILFRRELSQLTSILGRMDELLSEAGKFSRSRLIWTLDDERTIEFGAVQHYGDERKYQGRAHDLKAFDELAHFSEAQFRTLCGWLRSADPAQRCRVIATGNPPTDSEGEWIIRYFAPWLDRTHPNPAEPGELRWYTTLAGEDTELRHGRPFEYKGDWIVPRSRTFVPARVEDNPYYMASGYKATLQALPEPLRSKMLYGDFSAGHEDNPYQLIPTHWLEEAMDRHDKMAKPDIPLSAIGVDVARGGKDRTVLTLRYGHWIAPLRAYPGKMTPDGETVAQLVLAARGTATCRVHVDVIGVGASVYDALRRHIGDKVLAFNGAQGTEAVDRTGQITFVNRRAEWWWSLRESLDPACDTALCLPRDRELLSDLASPRYRFTPRGVLIESKDDITRRIGRSPDKGDSLAYANAVMQPTAGGFLDYYAQHGWEEH